MKLRVTTVYIENFKIYNSNSKNTFYLQKMLECAPGMGIAAEDLNLDFTTNIPIAVATSSFHHALPIDSGTSASPSASHRLSIDAVALDDDNGNDMTGSFIHYVNGNTNSNSNNNTSNDNNNDIHGETDPIPILMTETVITIVESESEAESPQVGNSIEIRNTININSSIRTIRHQYQQQQQRHRTQEIAQHLRQRYYNSAKRQLLFIFIFMIIVIILVVVESAPDS